MLDLEQPVMFPRFALSTKTLDLVHLTALKRYYMNKLEQKLRTSGKDSSMTLIRDMIWNTTNSSSDPFIQAPSRKSGLNRLVCWYDKNY